MRKSCIELFGLYIFFVVSLSSYASNISIPEVNITKSHFDFGDVDSGEVLVHEYEVSNTGDSDLELTGYTVSCGSCVTILDKPKIIKPNETKNIKVEFDTKGKIGNSVQKILVSTNDPDNKRIILSLEALVKSVWSNYSYIDFGNVSKGKEYHKDILLFSSGLENVSWEARVEDCNNLSIETFLIQDEKKFMKNHSEVIGRINLNWNVNSLLMGRYSNKLVIMTNKKGFEKIDIPISAYIKGDNDKVIPKIFFGAAKKGQTIKRVYNLSEYVPKELLSQNNLVLLTDHEFVAGSILLNKGEGHLEITLLFAVPEKSEKKIIKGNVRLLAGGKECISIPYFGYISSQ